MHKLLIFNLEKRNEKKSPGQGEKDKDSLGVQRGQWIFAEI